MKKQTKPQKFADYFKVFKAIKSDTPIIRMSKGPRDGSIPTHPATPVLPLLERDVLQDCITQLRKWGLKCDRNNTGFGDIHGTGQKYRYGIVGAGDIIGLRKDGIHFEIECKAGKGGRLSLKQQKRWRDVCRNNGIYLVIHGKEELEMYKDSLVIKKG